MAVSVTDSASPAHDSIGVSGRDKVPCSWLVGLPAAPAEDCVKGAEIAVSVILGGVWET